METKKMPITIYAESTPNPASMKFVADRNLVEGDPIECTSVEQAKISPLAAKLFQFPFVTRVFILSNFVTVTKSEVVEWSDIHLELKDMIQNYLSEGNPVVTDMSVDKNSNGKAVMNSNPAANLEQTEANQSGELPTEERPDLKSEIDQKISGILDEYIRPAVEQDGGAINFKSFKDGIVTVVLRGSCSGCPSSTLTLKAGIESLLRQMVPDVKEVIAEEL